MVGFSGQVRHIRSAMRNGGAGEKGNLCTRCGKPAIEKTSLCKNCNYESEYIGYSKE